MVQREAALALAVEAAWTVLTDSIASTERRISGTLIIVCVKRGIGFDFTKFEQQHRRQSGELGQISHNCIISISMSG